MKKIIYLFLFVSVFTVKMQAQVVIGKSTAPDRNAALELKHDSLGFLPTRVELEDLDSPAPLNDMVEGMVVYNLTEDTGKGLRPGLYYCNGNKWIRLRMVTNTYDWFYMPSIQLDTTPGEHTVNLYDKYVEQVNDPVAVSAGGPLSLPNILGATDIHYIVLDCDDTVFDADGFEISSVGEMKYTVIGTPTEASYINIVFAVNW